MVENAPSVLKFPYAEHLGLRGSPCRNQFAVGRLRRLSRRRRVEAVVIWEVGGTGLEPAAVEALRIGARKHAPYLTDLCRAAALCFPALKQIGFVQILMG
jgi:hypothetical protein